VFPHRRFFIFKLREQQYIRGYIPGLYKQKPSKEPAIVGLGFMS